MFGSPRLVAIGLLAMLLVARPSAAVPSGLVVTHGSTFVPGDKDASVAGQAVPLPDTLYHTAGNDLMYANLDLVAHSVTSVKFVSGSATKRLFDSGLKQFGQSDLVAGVEKLAPGSYAFFCFNHVGMRGTLVVV